jgi:hypothetical protein
LGSDISMAVDKDHVFVGGIIFHAPPVGPIDDVLCVKK